jgi:hypothetical protein
VDVAFPAFRLLGSVLPVSVVVSVGFSETCAQVRFKHSDFMRSDVHARRMNTGDLRCVAFRFGVVRSDTESL